MAWQPYVVNLMEDGKITEVGIFGLERHESWGCSPGFKNITAEEVVKLIGSRNEFPLTGVYIRGIKYRVLTDLMDEPQSLCLNLKAAVPINGNAPCVSVGKSEMALFIVQGNDFVGGGTVSEKLYKILCHLRSSNM